MKSLEDDKPDLKDYVEHLRTIHFSLLASCIALIIAVQFLPGREWYDAKNHLERLTPFIIGLNNSKIEELERAVINQAIACFRRKLDRPNFSPARCTYDDEHTDPQLLASDFAEMPGTPKPLNLKNVWRAEVTSLDGQEKLEPIVSDGDVTACCVMAGGFKTKLELKQPIKAAFTPRSEIPSLPQPPTLNDYKKVWDAFSGNSTIEIPWDLQIALQPTVGKLPEPKFEKEVPGNASNTTILSKTDTEGRREKIVYVSEDLPSSEFPSPVKLEVTVATKKIHVNPGFWLTQDKGFNEKTANLFKLAADNGLMGLEVPKAQDNINKKLAEKGGNIHVAGLQVPSDMILSWGIAVIIGLQLYALVHLKFYSRILIKNYTHKVAWVGNYTDELSKIIFFLTTVLLPSITVLYLGYKLIADPEFNYQFAVILIIFISVLISYSTIKFIRLVWKKQEPNSHGAASSTPASSETQSS